MSAPKRGGPHQFGLAGSERGIFYERKQLEARCKLSAGEKSGYDFFIEEAR
jgi:hypothetical protein